MKKVILIGLLTLRATGVLAQGVVSFQNLNGTNLSPTATSSGLIWRQPAAGPAVLETAPNLYGTLLGGATPDSLAALNPVLSPGSPSSSWVLLDYNLVPGQYLDDLVLIYAVPGVAPAGFAYFQVQLWEGTAPNYAAAVAEGAYAGLSGVFSNRVYLIDYPYLNLDGMPAVVLTVPEPGMFSLAGLGSVVLLIFRRK